MSKPNRLEEHRTRLGVTQSQLSRMSDVSVTTIARIERAKRTGSPYIRFRLLNALNRFADEEGHSEITIEDLFPQDGHRP